MSFYMLVISLGIHLSFHFHKNQLTCFSLIGSDQFCCHNHDHPNHDNCNHSLCEDHNCHIKYVHITLENDFLIKSFEYSSEFVFQSAQGTKQPFNVNSLAVEYTFNQANAPPNVPIYLKNSSLLFYG